MKWNYCEQWNKLTESPMHPLTSREAEHRHTTGELYTGVPAGDGGNGPGLRVEIRLSTGYAAVIFMDEFGRDELNYTFELDGNRLFLRKAVAYDYGDSQERGGYADAHHMERYSFTTDGVAHRVVVNQEEESREGRDGIDVTTHWEPVPDFGEYDSLIRRERGEPDVED